VPEREAESRQTLRGLTFEQQRKLNAESFAGLPAKSPFTESLILAQDERWRRA
jgi:hypothetical protein